MLIYPFFLFFIAYLYDISFGYLTICIVGVVSCYEIGYLINDFVTVRWEINPTIRAGGSEGWFAENLVLNIISRFLYCFFFLILLFLLCFPYLLEYVTGLVLIQGIFFLHNYFRNKINVISYFFLVSLRYIVPLLPVLDVSLFLVVIVSFPVCRTIEHACKYKYGFNLLQTLIKDRDVFRVKYYISIFIISMVLFGFSKSVLLPFYFLFLRIGALYASKFVFFNRLKHSSYKW